MFRPVNVERDPYTGTYDYNEVEDYGPVHDPEKIPPGWGAHIGGGEWITKCPEEGCGDLIPGTLPVDIQRHLWDRHKITAPLLPS